MNLYNSVYLTTEEFLLLASGAGLEQIEGVFRDSPDEVTRERLCESLFTLCNRGLMSNVNENGAIFFKPEKILEELFQNIKKAQSTSAAFRYGEEEPALYCYIGKMTVVCEVSQADENAIRIFELPYEEFGEWMEEKGYYLKKTL